jgi:SNF2 family DNA or RNA helicase
MTIDQLQPDKVLQGPIFPEPVQVIVVVPMGSAVKVVGKGINSGRVYEPILTMENLAALETSPDVEPFDGDPQRFRIGIEAMRLALGFEYDPYFSLSIARVDPLPHQLEAVYDYFLALPRIRFLLADDPGAGKTIMAGLLLKELKVRGLVKRTLIITPASLSFQWQREMKDKFRENFEVIRSDVLRANYGSNPWQEKNQVITSVSWVSRVEDAKESLLRSQWDLIIVDEAHKMSAASRDKKTLAYQLGEALSGMTDHYLLMTATPHKGDPKNFCLFLELLDRDVYGDVKSLEEAMRKHEAPFYLRRVKEALVTFPDPESGKVKELFTKRMVQTTEFQISDDEWDFYDALTRYVEDQSIKAAAEDSAHGRALGFTMAMLQRRFASSIYAVRRSLERMKDKRAKILADPEGHRRGQINKRLPDEFEDLPDDEQQEIIAELEDLVVSYDPATLREEIVQLSKLITEARHLEKREIESKLVKLRELITEHGIFKDPKMKLLIFTEHKDTLDFLAGEGKDGRPLGKLIEWGLSVTQIHGGMKVGDRNSPGTRIFAEREFRESCQVLIATEAAGEGINLQFCWFMLNYDIPWNPVRLEQRMGRIHRYGQEKDCLIFNFVSTNTREGRVLQKLHLLKDPTLEWVTPGHPLFESVREEVTGLVRADLQRGSVFFDLHARAPYHLSFFAASIKDGRDHQLHRRLFAVQADANGCLSIKQPTILLDLALAPKGTIPPAGSDLVTRTEIEQFLVENALNPFLAEVTAQRVRETQTIARHLEISLNELIHRQNMRLAELMEQQEHRSGEPLIAANMKQTEDRLDELNGRLERRRIDLQQERECMIGDIQHIGCAWVLPHPERTSPQIAPMVSDPEIERIAIEQVIASERARGCMVESVESENRGFDLISRKPHPEDPKTAIEVRFIEVKGRAHTGEIALTTNEYNTAKRLKKDFWLYVVFHCASQPSLNIIQDPATLDWQPIVKIEHYRLKQDSVKHPVELKEDAPPYRTGGDA